MKYSTIVALNLNYNFIVNWSEYSLYFSGDAVKTKCPFSVNFCEIMSNITGLNFRYLFHRLQTIEMANLILNCILIIQIQVKTTIKLYPPL